MPDPLASTFNRGNDLEMRNHAMEVVLHGRPPTPLARMTVSDTPQLLYTHIYIQYSSEESWFAESSLYFSGATAKDAGFKEESQAVRYQAGNCDHRKRKYTAKPNSFSLSHFYPS